MIDDFKAILCKHESSIISFEQAPEVSISTSTSVIVPQLKGFCWLGVKMINQFSVANFPGVWEWG